MKFKIRNDSKTNSDYLINKYKFKITPGEKTVEELILFLKGKVDITETVITELTQSILEHVKYNVIHGIRNQDNLSADDLNFNVFKLLKNEKSNSYYQYYVPNIANYNDNTIYIVFEKKTRSIYTNNNKLLLELFIERGISQYDYDNNTNLLSAYLFHLDTYSKGEY